MSLLFVGIGVFGFSREAVRRGCRSRDSYRFFSVVRKLKVAPWWVVSVQTTASSRIKGDKM